jgi:hypothetical protein
MEDDRLLCQYNISGECPDCTVFSKQMQMFLVRSAHVCMCVCECVCVCMYVCETERERERDRERQRQRDRQS